MSCKYCSHCNNIKKNLEDDKKKVCKDCKCEKQLTDFNIRLTNKDGTIKLRAESKICQAVRNKKAYARRKVKALK